ncbi:hypothetical protein J6O86_00040 [bacterium]|nr:hypothetical protein [bacterium]
MPVGKNLLAGLKQRPALTPQPTHLPLGEGAVVGEFMSRTTAGEGDIKGAVVLGARLIFVRKDKKE